MESVSSPGSPSPESSPDFAFAFNDVNFSDRILRIEVLPDSPRSESDPGDRFAGWARNRKRRRDDQLGDSSEVTVQGEEQILNCNMTDLDDGATHENQEEEAVAMIEESVLGLKMAAYQTGHEVAQVNETSNSLDHLEARLKTETSSSMDYLAARVKTIHISSPILAAKSSFFYKLFSNGMRESVQRDITLRIQESEEPALMDMLNFMYCNTLRSMTPPALLDVLMASDKYEVASCMRYCSRLLRKLPMSCESALLYLDLPLNILMADTVQPLTDAAKQFLAARFKDINKFQEEVLNLPLAGVEAVLFCDDLQVASEDAVYDFVMKWAKTHYSKPEERREILSTRLLRFVRFPCMTCRKLKKVLMSSDIDTELASKVVLDALFFKAEAPYRQQSLRAEEPNNTFRRFVERAYKYRPVKVVEFESPHQQCIVYLDLKRVECANLFTGGRVYSQAFHLGGQGFFLSGHCNMDQQSLFHCFGLFLGMQEKGSVAFSVDYEFASRTKPSEEFVSKYKGSYTFTGGKAVGYRNLFGVPWTAFIDDDSPYFINDVLHLKARLSLQSRNESF